MENHSLSKGPETKQSGEGKKKGELFSFFLHTQRWGQMEEGFFSPVFSLNVISFFVFICLSVHAFHLSVSLFLHYHCSIVHDLYFSLIFPYFFSLFFYGFWMVVQRRRKERGTSMKKHIISFLQKNIFFFFVCLFAFLKNK